MSVNINQSLWSGPFTISRVARQGTQATLRSRYNNPSLDVIMTQFKPTRCVFYSFMYSLTNRQGLLPIDTLRQKSRFSGAASPPWRMSRATKKPLGEVQLSPISTIHRLEAIVRDGF